LRLRSLGSRRHGRLSPYRRYTTFPQVETAPVQRAVPLSNAKCPRVAALQPRRLADASKAPVTKMDRSMQTSRIQRAATLRNQGELCRCMIRWRGDWGPLLFRWRSAWCLWARWRARRL